MAWITKQSGTMKIARRDEPYLTDRMRAHLSDDILPRYETRHAALLPALHLIQHQYGWVPHQAMLEVADFLGLPPAEVLDTASFYEEYWLKPKGRHVIAVCRSIACEFCDSRALTHAAMEHLGIEVGETTDDGEFTLIELECLGACGGAPALLLDEALHEFSNPDELIKGIEALRGSGPHAHH
ncbi:MAG: complex I 24 kDa subunit family protein [Phycisphaerales bacterium JB037]